MKRLVFLLLFLVLFDTSIYSQQIRGVWVPDPSHTDLLHSYINLRNGVILFKELGINTIFLCTYAGTKVAFKSKVYMKNSSNKTVDESYMFEPYLDTYSQIEKSPTGDPVKDLINESAKYNIKVIFWFEFGFMASHGITPKSHPLLSKNPDWESAGNDGIESNYNNTDYYFNAYNPKVQDFFIKLILESIRLYPKVAGIQGDDRMPAMPANSGYDLYTVTKYKSEHNGTEPPNNFRNREWIEWRLNILNNFGKLLYNKIKSVGKNYLVCFAPNPFPWCRENLMQDTDSWLKKGIVDLLSVQCYRFNFPDYKKTLDDVISNVKSVTDKISLNPGIILKVEGKDITPEVLEKQIQYNREIGTNGETFFYNEALKRVEIQKVLKNSILF